MRLGYFLSSEEHGPLHLVQQAQGAERAGFDGVFISDHFHPWLEDQGHSPFVWSVIGGIAACTGLEVTTGVTCPTVRIHPAILAQAAATSALMLRGRFRFGVGTGENLNEHILGDVWPPVDVRLEMLEEAVGLIRELWKGGLVTHRGRHYTVHTARIYDAPEPAPPVLMSGFGDKSIGVAARIADGFVTTKPDAEAVRAYRDAGGRGPVVGAVKACYAPTEAEARRIAHSRWRSQGVPGQLAQELALPAFFEQASQLVTVESTGESIACGPDPERHVAAIEEYRKAGFDDLYVSQIGEDHDGFFAFFTREVRPRLGG